MKHYLAAASAADIQSETAAHRANLTAKRTPRSAHQAPAKPRNLGDLLTPAADPVTPAWVRLTWPPTVWPQVAQPLALLDNAEAMAHARRFGTSRFGAPR